MTKAKKIEKDVPPMPSYTFKLEEFGGTEVQLPEAISVLGGGITVQFGEDKFYDIPASALVGVRIFRFSPITYAKYLRKGK